jgi:NodT family efflux transporter outer membrane factor (OMF) lipoprotein
MKKLLAFALCSTILAGCVDAPSTTPSQTPLVSQTLGLGAEQTPAVADDWWTAFGDPQLNALVDQALNGSPTLSAAIARVHEAQSQLSSERALTYPQVTLDGNETRERFSKVYEIPPPPLGPGGTTQWIGNVQANLSWSLDLFGKQSAQIDSARETAGAAALDATATRLLLAGSVTQAYVSLWRSYVLIDAAQETVKQQGALNSLTAGRVRAGLDDTASQKQSEALLALAKEDLTQANANRDLAVHAIAALIGRGADAYNITRPQLSDTALTLPQTLPADLLARRADIAAAEARINAATAGRQAAHQAFYPDINLIGLAGFAAIGLSPMFTSAAQQYGGGGAIHLPIFDAGKLRADYAGATARLDEAVADYNQSVVTAVKQTADALTQIENLRQQSGQQKIALDAANASFDLATRRYHSGLSPQLNALNAETILIQARRQNAALAADAAAARVSLLMAIGGGFTPDNSSTQISASQDKTP